VTVLIDDRAGSKPLASLPPLDTCSTLTRLDSADVAFAGNGSAGPITIGVETKSVGDMISSLANGRANGVDGQLAQMAQSYDVRWLLVYGLSRANPATGNLQVARTWAQKGHDTRFTVDWHDFSPGGSKPVRYSYLEGFLLSPAFQRLGVWYKQVATVEDAAWWLFTLYKSWQKQWSDHRGTHAFDLSQEVQSTTIKPIDPFTLQLAKTAASLPSIGYERGLAVAEHFPSIDAMINASTDDWAEVTTIDGKGKRRRLGSVVASAVMRAIHRKRQ
jgi:ERCC4-type nuclease